MDKPTDDLIPFGMLFAEILDSDDSFSEYQLTYDELRDCTVILHDGNLVPLVELASQQGLTQTITEGKEEPESNEDEHFNALFSALLTITETRREREGADTQDENSAW